MTATLRSVETAATAPGSLPVALRRLTRQVDRALERLLRAAGRSPAALHEAMRYCVLSGGKRFRPLLVLGACEASGKPAYRAMAAACAVELIHTYSLVHDDLPAMDNADTRRGRPSCHRQFGEANAVLAGDALLTLAFDILARGHTPGALAVLRVLSRASGTDGLIGGQVLDLEAAREVVPATAAQLTEIARRKTGALIAASVEAGALAGGAAATQRQRLRRYGRNVGLAFQLFDDVHDEEGLARALGPEAAREQGRRLIRRAVGALEPFGSRAETLQQLAEWLGRT